MSPSTYAQQTSNGSEASSSSSGQLTPTSDPNAEALFVATKVLQQAVDLLPLLTEDSQLLFSSSYIAGSTIGEFPFRSGTLVVILEAGSCVLTHCLFVILLVGKHLRHAWDHFNLLIQVRLYI